MGTDKKENIIIIISDSPSPTLALAMGRRSYLRPSASSVDISPSLSAKSASSADRS
jgi:hypothetical protein